MELTKHLGFKAGKLTRPLQFKAGKLTKHRGLKTWTLTKHLGIKTLELTKHRGFKAGQLTRPLGCKAGKLTRPMGFKNGHHHQVCNCFVVGVRKCKQTDIVHRTLDSFQCLDRIRATQHKQARQVGYGGNLQTKGGKIARI